MCGGRRTVQWKSWVDGGCVCHYLHAEDTTESDVSAALCEFLARLFREIGSAYAPTQWDTVYFELWLDGGRIIAYPALAPNEGLPDRTERLCIQVDVRAYEREFDRVARMGASDAVSARAWNALTARAVEDLTEAARTNVVSRAAAELLSVRPFRCIGLEYEGEAGTFELPLCPGGPEAHHG